MQLETIKAIAEREMACRSSHPWKETGNKYYHGERTARLALTLRRELFPEDGSHDGILTAASWFHDLRNGAEKHWELGARDTRQLLRGLCTPEELDEICEIILLHDRRDPENRAYSPWLRLVQDADYLDHFGTYDVWMNFAYGSYAGQSLQEMEDFFLVERPQEDAVARRTLNYSVSLKIYEEKAAFLHQFGERFRAECRGEVWNREQILRQKHDG